MVSFVWRERGDVPRLNGDFDLAKTYAQKSIAIAKEINYPYPITLSYWFLGNVAVDEGEYATALRYFESYKQTSAPKQEHPGGPGWAYVGLGKIVEAQQSFVISLRLLLANEARPVGLDALVGLAYVKARSGHIEAALELLALVSHHGSSSWEVKEKARKLWEDLVAELPADLIAEAETRGRELDLFETAVSLLAEEEQHDK